MAMIEGMDYVVRQVGWLTGDIDALVQCDEDGLYNIYVNENLSPEAAREAVSHELAHIKRDDMFNPLPIIAVEGLRREKKRTADPGEPESQDWLLAWAHRALAMLGKPQRRRRKGNLPEDDPFLPRPFWR